MVGMLPDGSVRVVFLASDGDKNGSPVKATDLDAAEDGWPGL